MQKIALLMLFGFYLSLTNVFAAQLESKVESSISAEISNDLASALQSLEKVVNINSGTMNFEGVKKVGLFFQSELESIGFKTQWEEGSSFNRAGHLTATYGVNSDNINILLIGHLDTVFSKQDDFQVFSQIDPTHYSGPGITDMKGGDIILLYALRALKSLNLLDKVNIKIVMTGDEESSGRPLSASKKAIVDAAIWADIALGFEDGDGDIKTAVVSRRGATGWTLTVKGKPAHSSQIFRQDIGYGAIFEAARILNEFREALSAQEYLTLSPGLVVGGTRTDYDKESYSGSSYGKNNVIAKALTVTGDLRALSIQQLIKVRKKMQQIVSTNLPHTSAELIFSDGYPPMGPRLGNQQLLALYSQISIDLGYGEVDAVNPSRAGAADISFAADHVQMALDGLGLMGTGGHTKNEIADITSLEKNIQKAAILIYRLSQRDKVKMTAN